MISIKRLLILLLILNFNIFCNAKEIKILATVNDQIITSYDVYKEKNINNIIGNKNFKNNNINLILNLMIESKLKEIEFKKINLKINEELVEKEFSKIMQPLKGRDLDSEIKIFLKNKVRINLKWAQLIRMKYGNSLEVNMNEINLIIKEKKIPSKKKQLLINQYKNKKFQIFSKTYLNEIKKNYFIKKYI